MMQKTIGMAHVATAALATGSMLATGGCATAPEPPYASMMAATVAVNPVPQRPVTDDPSQSALANVCHLTIRRVAGLVFRTSFTGSAVLYRGQYLLTAGHNILSRRSRVREIEVRCGVRNAWASAGLPQQIIRRDAAIAASGFGGSGPFERDFAVIRLDRPITTPVPVELAADNPAEGQLILSGYPGGVHDGHTLFSTPSPANRMEGEFLRYDIATYRSNSGGPVWRMRDGRAELVAIHVRSGGGGRVVNQAFRDEVARMIAVLDSRAADSRRAAR